MTYCDTSFLSALYVEIDPFHIQAIRLAASFSQSIPFTLLAELELENSIRRGWGSRTIGRQEHDAIFRHIADDKASDILSATPLPQIELFNKARELSKKFTPELACRSLDILHVAAALLLRTSEFASFDERQRLLAARVGLKTVPSLVTKKKA